MSTPWSLGNIHVYFGCHAKADREFPKLSNEVLSVKGVNPDRKTSIL
jgi:hypothetical protein